MAFDKNKPYGVITGEYKARYVQDGKEFDADFKVVNGGRASNKSAPANSNSGSGSNSKSGSK